MHVPNSKPTWKSYGHHKVCKCVNHDCNCKPLQRFSWIDNAYISLGAKASLEVIEDAKTDHYPLLIKVENLETKKTKLKSIWCLNTSKIKSMDFETALGYQDFSKIHDLTLFYMGFWRYVITWGGSKRSPLLKSIKMIQTW